jgi:mono/diheme cytochrome c family protein
MLVRRDFFVPFFALIACGGGEVVGDATAGESVFTANCVACHPADGTAGVGPALAEEVEAGDEADLEETIRGGAGAMPAFEGNLSDQEIADVVAFLIDTWG